MTTKLERYTEKIYAGFLAKNIAVRLAAPVEPISWTYERIKETFPLINDYLKPADDFASDDDINGPAFFIRAILDEETTDIDAEAIGRSWLNYTREGKGMFWWGGVGVSTEHTAYHNLLSGMKAPESGSAEVNGLTMAEQIGGQIFIDTWGLLFPDNPSLAADYAEKAASVSHDQNGIYGARFMAACISQAFSDNDVFEIIETGLKEIPEGSTYARIIQAVLKFHEQHPADFRKCRDYLNSEWGYDRYPGVCHIIPNAGICILSLLYGEADFARTIEIATMCGWDTDCNAGNVATILGVMNGLNNIPANYRTPIHDTAIASSGIGYLNMIDLPSFAKELALYRQYIDQDITKEDILKAINGLYYDFALPGSTHGFKTINPNKLILRHGPALGEAEGSNALHVVVDNINQGDVANIYIKTNYHPEDLADERYEPVFSPKAYSGQKITMRVNYEGWVGDSIYLRPYVKSSGEVYRLEECLIRHGGWETMEFMLPEVPTSLIDEVGFYVETKESFADGNGTLGNLLIDYFTIDGNYQYKLSMQEQQQEFGSITPFTHSNTEAQLAANLLLASSKGVGVSLTGHYYTENIDISGVIEKLTSDYCEVIFRAKGLKDYYSVRFTNDKISIYEAKTDRLLTEQEFTTGRLDKYDYGISVNDSIVSVYLEKQLQLEFDQLPKSYGAYGFGLANGTIIVHDMVIKGQLVK